MGEFSRILLFFSVFGLLLLVWYIFFFLERHGYQCCLLISVNNF